MSPEGAAVPRKLLPGRPGPPVTCRQDRPSTPAQLSTSRATWTPRAICNGMRLPKTGPSCAWDTLRWAWRTIRRPTAEAAWNATSTAGKPWIFTSSISLARSFPIWTILRMGHTSVGMENHPAPDGGGGLECDKYSREAMDFHFEHFFGALLSALGPLAAKGLAGSLIDSYEVGMQTWTPLMPQEFERRRGYSMRPYLPALTGRVVGSGDVSDRFLWDIRRTHADMMADNYYGRFAELCRQHAMKPYAEPYSGGPFDEMQSGSRLDVPMGEFWVARNTAVNRSVKLAASVGHVYGKPVIGAESYTGQPQFSKWQEYPFQMKAQGDWMYTQGLNQFIFHRYAHQPHPDAVPGRTMGHWGFHFDRTNTWWNPGKAWLKYAARCQNMLRQGLFVADLLYFEGENAPLAAPTLNELKPAPPPGYDWDTCDRQALLERIKIVTRRRRRFQFVQ